MNANEIVSKIRDNLPNDKLPLEMHQQPDREDQVKATQRILDRGIEIHIVNQPIGIYKNNLFSLYSYLLDGPMTVPSNVRTVIIWCWFMLPDGREVIRIASDYQEVKEKCVYCGSITPYNKNDDISIRKNYIEGAGQLCDSCFIDIYGGK